MRAERAYREGDWIRFNCSTPHEEIGRIASIDRRDHLDDFRSRVSHEPQQTTNNIQVRCPNGDAVWIRPSQILGISDVVSTVAGLAGRKLSIRFRWRLDHEHVRVTLFVGQPGCTLANAGSLCFRDEEWTSFTLAMRLVTEVSRTVDVDFIEEEPA